MSTLFVQAVNSIVDGDQYGLRTILEREPRLVAERSPRHGATLLHYVSANSPVEDELQKTPANAVEIARLLIDGGCAVDAMIDGQPASTPLVALVTSQFPAQAGLQRPLVELYLNSGAKVDGLNDDGYPLACALCFRYPDAIAALVAGGARVDNLVAAASLGDLEFVKSSFNSKGELLPSAVLAYPEPFMRSFNAREVLQAAIEHASYFGQLEMVEFLGEKIHAG